jgi:hypothetical protein
MLIHFLAIEVFQLGQVLQEWPELDIEAGGKTEGVGHCPAGPASGRTRPG